MISVEQIKAARGLINITQADLAAKVGLSKHSMNNIERFQSNPREKTMRSIQRTLEQMGVVFTDGTGVKMVQDVFSVTTFEGSESFFKLLNDVMETLPDGGYMLISGIDEASKEIVTSKRAMAIFKKRLKMGIISRILIKEGYAVFTDPIEHYRWLDPKMFNQVPYYVYGNKYALRTLHPFERVVIIENKAIAESYRKVFYANWKQGKIPTAS